MQLRRLALVLTIAVAPAAARAQSSLTFASGLSNPIAGNYYVGPYSGTFTPPVGQASGISIICVDFLNEVYFNDHYAVNVTTLGSSSNPLTTARHPGQLADYRRAAWMGSLFSVAPTSYWGSIQYAIWNVFTPTQAPDDALSPLIAEAANVAASHEYGAFDYYGVHFDAVDMSRWSLITDVAAAGSASGGRQEFLTGDQLPMSAVPEPGTFVLLATALGGIGFVVRRRTTRREGAE